MITLWGHISDKHPKGWGNRMDTYFDIIVMGAMSALLLAVILESMVIFVCGFASVVFPGVCHF